MPADIPFAMKPQVDSYTAEKQKGKPAGICRRDGGTKMWIQILAGTNQICALAILNE